jgi:hypothetical protein
MAEGADQCSAWLLSQLFNPVGACAINGQNHCNGDYINALSFYCGLHDGCLDPVKK